MQKEFSIPVSIESLGSKGYHLFIKVKINGRSCRFLIDTGASHSVISKSYFERSVGKRKLKSVKHATTGLHSSTSESSFGKVERLDIGKVAVKNHVYPAVDLSHVNSAYKKLKIQNIKGILGSDLLLKYKMIIHYGLSQLIIP